MKKTKEPAERGSGAPKKVPITEVEQDRGQTGVASASKTIAPKKVPTKQHKKWQKVVFWVVLLLMWVFVSVVASQLVVGMVMGAILGHAITNTVWSGVYAVISYALALFLILWAPPKLAKKWKISRELLGLKGYLTWTDIGLGVVGFIVSTVLAAGLVWLFSMFPWFDAGQAQETGFSVYMSGGERVIAFLVLVVLAPVLEEVIFRGWLYGKLRSRLSVAVSIILVSLLFALMHFQWNVSVNVFALSVVLCVLREITGTIYAGMLTHMVKNGVAFYILYVLGA